MITETCQRWTERRESRRPSGEVIQPSAFDVVEFTDSDQTAVDFVQRHHYSGSCSARSYTFGLYQRGELAGVAVFGMSASMAAMNKAFPTLGTREKVELGRFVLVDSVPGNGESFFLARCFAALRGRVVGVVSCADPEPRRAADGRTVLHGHVGTIYQATNGRYVGKTNESTLRLFCDGTVFSNVSSGKIRGKRKGWRYAAAQLEARGADKLAEGASDEERIAWLERWRGALTVARRHRGNHRYLWCLDKRRRGILPTTNLPYPKIGGV